MNAGFAETVRHRVRDLSADQLRTICRLYDRVWPMAAATLAERADELGAGWVREDREAFVVWEGAAPIATAMFFPREIMTAGGALRVLALAGVCSAPEFRGRGLGARVVTAVFELVNRGAFGVALFQTAAPGFYEKLGARRVGNPFVNSRWRPGMRGSAEGPWWDPHVMIYRASSPWPEGPIDLLGEGF